MATLESSIASSISAAEPQNRLIRTFDLLTELKYNSLQNILISGLFAVLFSQFCAAKSIWTWWGVFAVIAATRGVLLHWVQCRVAPSWRYRNVTIYGCIGATAIAWGFAPLVCGTVGDMSMVLAITWIALIVIAGAGAFQADPIATSVLAFPATLPSLSVLLVHPDRTSFALVAAIGLVYAHLAIGNVRAKRGRDLELRLTAENERLMDQYQEQARLASEELDRRLVIERELRAARHRAEQLSSVDSLTGIANRRSFDERLAHEMQRAFRAQKPLSLVLLDIDCFKQYNDALGHGAGDDCLAEVGQILSQFSRRTGDLAARYGGEEFVLLLSDTDKSHAARIAESVREAILARAIPHENSRVAEYVTTSIGVATTIPHVDHCARALIDAADKALYRAKEQGRNRVVSAA